MKFSHKNKDEEILARKKILTLTLRVTLRHVTVIHRAIQLSLLIDEVFLPSHGNIRDVNSLPLYHSSESLGKQKSRPQDCRV